MTWISGLPTFENVPARGTTGCRGLVFPVLEDLGEVRLPFPGCHACPRWTTHLPTQALGVSIPYGETSTQRIPAGQTPTAVKLHKLFGALWLLGYCQNGVAYGTLYNMGLGTANNVSQQVTYEIVSASGTTLTLRGRNPKCISFGASRINPDWPLPDPITGETSRLIFSGQTCCLPAGAMCVFEPPSVLEGKRRPYIVSVTPPASDDLEDVEFSVTLSASASYACQPYNLKHPPADGKYHCTFYFYATIPEGWPNWQVPTEAQWTLRDVTWTKAEIDTAAGLLPLRNSADADARVLPPDLFTGAMAVIVSRIGQDDEWITDGATLLAQFSTTVVTPGSAWATTLDVTPWRYADLTAIRVLFRPEARSADTFRQQHYGSCANSQASAEGYVHGTFKRCMNPNCSGFGDYADTCWQPNANKFCLGTESNVYRGEMADPKPSDPFNSEWWSLVWTRSSGYVKQGLPGISSYRNFAYVRWTSCGTSVQELLGAFCDELYGGFFATVWPMFYPSLGEREEYEESGAIKQRILTGAFLRAVAQNLGSNPVLGSIPGLVSGWTTRQNDPLGVAWASKLAQFPRQAAGRCHLYTFNHGGNGRPLWCFLSTSDEDSYGTAMRFKAAETATETTLRSRLQ